MKDERDVWEEESKIECEVVCGWWTTCLVNEVFNLAAHLVLFAGAGALERREGLVKVGGRGVARVLDKEYEVIGGLKLDLAVADVHGSWGDLTEWRIAKMGWDIRDKLDRGEL